MSTPGIELLDRRARLLTSLDRRERRNNKDLDEITGALSRILEGPAEVRRITWEDDERLARRLAGTEPVNPVRGEADLRRRFADDRRVFVIEHPALPGRPMNVVWAALVTGIPDRLSDVIGADLPPVDPDDADTIAYYSIWNAESGLAGLGRGRDLIVGALDAIDAELGNGLTHVTLSPVPGLRRWLDAGAARPVSSAPPAMDELAARYLTSTSDSGRLLDPVARFHLGNGARLLRVLPDADDSERGRERSFGLMANYRYAPEDRAANLAALRQGDMALGEQVATLLGSARSARPSG